MHYFENGFNEVQGFCVGKDTSFHERRAASEHPENTEKINAR